MKLLIVSCLLAFAAADVSHLKQAGGEQNAQILRQESDVDPEGNFQYAFETDNGIQAQAQGQLKSAGEEAAVVIQGQNAWKTPEGEQVQLTYVADENGYQPQGSHLPTPSPIPEAIIRALEYIRAHPPPPEQN
ncbi:larval cuticle protein LCP-17-like [Leguminivora glycinivorella]|uniref:larval cuticle protein LCP-17-like n=1 Tax=Leguminivora glycinivorella TaxID=1035111 RepID=UPI00200FBE4B|nr:larval cuticle protein LCP-17-like [Leguminivora glycinivorella]